MNSFFKKYWILLVSIFLFLISLTQIAFCGERNSCPSGGFAVIGGIFTLLGSPCAIPWLANPLLILSWIFYYKKPKRTLLLTVAALVCACSFLFFEKAMVSSQGESTIISYGLGYWLWLGSIVSLLIGRIVFGVKQ